MALRGFALTISGVPYVLSTAGVSSMPTSTSGLWFGAESGVALAAGYLDTAGLRWAERARPLAGELDVDAITFRLFDAVPGAGIASGEHLLTWLATRSPDTITSTPLALTLSASGTSATVGSGAALTASTWAWIDREAVYVSAIVGNVLTITRGRLGTAAVEHVAGDDINPEVFASVPWVQRRKVVLWSVDSAGVASPVWVGFCVRAPRISGDGRTFDLACDPYLQVVSDGPIGSTQALTRIVGYGEGARSAPAWGANALGLQIQCTGHGGPAVASSWRSYRTWEQLAADVADRFAQATLDRGHRIDAFISRVGTRGRVDIDDATHTFFAGVWWLGAAATTELMPSRNRGGAHEYLALEFGPIPAVAYAWPDQAPLRLAVTETTRLPSTWTETTEDSGTDHVTRSRRILRTTYSADWYADSIVLGSTATGTPLAPFVTTISTYLSPRKYGLAPPAASEVLVLKDPPPLQSAWRVATGHWAWGLRRAALPLVDDVAAEVDWDWSTLPDVVAATIGHSVTRSWVFDGRRKLGDLLRECCLLAGVTPAIRGGRVVLHPWQWPRSGETPAATITAVDIIGTPQWSTWDDGLANRLELQSDSLGINVLEAGSVARYGPGQTITVKLGGVDQQQPLTDDPYTLARQVLGRLSLWSDPLATVRVELPLSFVDGARATLTIGSLVQVSDWISPDGTGDRGLSAQRGTVYAREVDYERGVVAVDLLLWPRVSYGYAPCARVLSVVSSTTVDIDATPIGSVDYAGGTDGLGGTGTGAQTLFAAGDRVQLLTRDATTLTAENRVISTITWTGTEWRVAFTVALSAGMQAAIGAGPVDIRGSTYSTAGLTDAQKSYMHVADDVTLVIGGTADRARRIAP